MELWIFGLSINPNLTWDFIQEYQGQKWDWIKISYHKCITFDIYKNSGLIPKTFFGNPNLTINELNIDCISFEHLSQNPNLTFEFILEYQNQNWDWYELSKHKCITWNLVQDYHELPWDYFGLSENPNITMDIIENNMDFDWCYIGLIDDVYCGIINNPNLISNFNFIQKNKQKFYEELYNLYDDNYDDENLIETLFISQLLNNSF